MTKLKRAVDGLCACEYPASVDDLKDDCKDVTDEFQDGSTTTLGAIIEVVEDPPETFASSDDLRSTLMSLAPRGSVGRANYDDRGATHNSREQQSF